MQRITPSTISVFSSLRSFPTRASFRAAASRQPLIARALSTTTPKMSLSSAAYLDAIKVRRTVYALNKDLPVEAQRVQDIAAEALQHVPSSFNSQSNRLVVLLGAEHDRLWDITTETLRAIVPADKWEPTGKKMAMFKAAAGTVRFPPAPERGHYGDGMVG